MNAEDIDRVIEMAWEDRTLFEAMKAQSANAEADVVVLMWRELNESVLIYGGRLCTMVLVKNTHNCKVWK